MGRLSAAPNLLISERMERSDVPSKPRNWDHPYRCCVRSSVRYVDVRVLLALSSWESSACQYFEDCLGRSEYCGFVSGDGSGYTLELTLDSGRSYRIPVCVAEDEFLLSMPKDAVEPEFPTHRVPLCSPIPKGIQDMLRFLALPNQKLNTRRLEFKGKVKVRGN